MVTINFTPDNTEEANLVFAVMFQVLSLREQPKTKKAPLPKIQEVKAPPPPVAAKVEKKAEPEKTEPDAFQPTVEQVRELMIIQSRSGKTDDCRAILAKYNCNSITGLAEKDLPQVFQEASLL